jgi:uncharacterized heparinase superfamily protein
MSARLRGMAERLVFSSAPYRLLLAGSTPPNLLLTPAPGAGDAARGAAILRGEWQLAGERLGADDPFAATPGAEQGAALHGFGWLADLRAEGSDAARSAARNHIASWIAHHGEWGPLAWRGDVLGRRIVAWLTECPFFQEGGDNVFRVVFLRSLARQVRHLDRLARLGGPVLGPAGQARLEALIAFALACACLPTSRERLPRALVLLLHEVNAQVLPDGGHYQRSPALQLTVLQALVGLRMTLVAARQHVPSMLQAAIDRMAPMLRFYRHGDGKLALFNHTSEGDPAAIDALLKQTGAEGKPPPSAPHTGFQRLVADPLLVLVDTGTPPPPESDACAHAGTLSFELSYGPERLIVNCGARPHAHGEWLAAQRATAAHSTLVLANANSSDLLPSGGLGRRPRHVLCRREEADGAALIDASHDGYAPPFGVLHRRRLYLSAEGEDLRGEDRLARVRPGETLPFALRFHLHPDVQASLLHDGTAVLLRLPSGAGFRLDAAGGRLALEESIYLGGGNLRRAEQIVVESTLAGEEALVKWSLKRLGA